MANETGYRVRRHRVAHVTFGPAEIGEIVFAHVTWAFRPDFAAGVDPYPMVVTQHVWGEIGDKEVWFNTLGERLNTFGSGDLLGFDSPADFLPTTYIWTLVYRPTATERAEGFTLDILLSALADSYQKDGFSADIESAVVLAR